MEYVEGETLRSRLKRGALPPDDAISMTASLLEALVHSHAAGVVHRDIKPENIMLLPSGGVKLLDFGIAKEIGREISQQTDGKTVILRTSLTVHGMVVGTLGYMSPEQLRGDPVNESTDVFALGAVLYEALTGAPAFPGGTAPQRIAAVLSRELPPVRVDGLHEDIDTILKRAIARDPADRYRTAAAFLIELRLFATGDAVAALPNTLAVLDLQNLSGNPEDDWIGSGVAESLGVVLNRVEGIDLVSRNAVLRASASVAAAQSAVDPVSLGLAVGCRWVLTGSFQRMGPALRMTMRLVEVSTGKDVWSENLDGKLDGIFEMQDQLAQLTAESLELVLPQHEDGDAGPHVGAYEYYAKAQRLQLTMQRGELSEARENLERAIEIDPHYAPALAGLACTYAPFEWVQTGDPQLLELAVDYAQRAIAADSSWADGHIWLGYARWRQERIDEALECFREASRQKPDEAIIHYFAGLCRVDQGNWADACEELQRAARLESGAPFILGALGIALMRTGRLDAAHWALARAVEVERRAEGYAWGGAGISLAECLARQGDLEAARAECLRTLEHLEGGDHAMRSMFRAQALVKLGEITLEQGDRTAAKVAYDQAVNLLNSQPAGPGKGFFVVQALAGQARVTGDPRPFEQGLEIYEAREGIGFLRTIPIDDVTLVALGRAAMALRRMDTARSLFERARSAGASDATVYLEQIDEA